MNDLDVRKTKHLKQDMVFSGCTVSNHCPANAYDFLNLLGCNVNVDPGFDPCRSTWKLLSQVKAVTAPLSMNKHESAMLALKAKAKQQTELLKPNKN